MTFTPIKQDRSLPSAYIFDIDRTRCVQMYRESGITCFQVAEGNF